MLKNENGYSINFDSVQQRKALLNENGYLSYICMRGIMRLEILLSKKITFTDAQIYDGLFFFWMTEVKKDNEVNEFEKFISCSKKYDFLQIKSRNEKKGFPGDMFSKEFLCSAIELKELSDCILKITSNFIREDDIREIPNEIKKILKGRCIKQGAFTLEEYLSRVNNTIKDTSELYDEWTQYANRLREVDRVVSKYNDVISGWDNSRYHFDWFLTGKDSHNGKSCKEELLESVKNMMIEDNNCDRIFWELIKELDRVNGKRSYFVRVCEEILEQCKGSKTVCKQIREIMAKYDFYYNQAIAYQHECSNLFGINKLSNEKQVTELMFSREALWKLAHVSWKEFGDIYSKFVFDKKMENNIKTIQDILNKEDKALEAEIKDGPWNYCKTDNYEDKKISAYDMHFINENGAACDELYVWVNNVEEIPYKILYKIRLEN